jgi:hypothetical protein
MIADNCCRKSSNRRLAPVVATGETAGVGHKGGVLTIGRLLPVSPAKRTFSETVSMSQKPAQEQTLDSSSATVSFHFDHHRKRARGLSAIFLRRVPNSSLVSPARDDKKVGQCSMLILKGHLKTFIFSAKCPYRSRAEVRIAAQTRRCQFRP